MTKRQAIELWRCCECNATHDDEDDARECCQPSIEECYGCPDCDEVHSCERQALKCCEDQCFTRCPCCARDYSEHDINHFAVTVAGHCNTCNPMFSVEQQLQIEDLHWQHSPYQPQSLLA